MTVAKIVLTERERLILQKVAEGMTTPQIAEDLHLSPETIKWYRKKLLVKLGSSTSPEMIRKALENKIL